MKGYYQAGLLQKIMDGSNNASIFWKKLYYLTSYMKQGHGIR